MKMGLYVNYLRRYVEVIDNTQGARKVHSRVFFQQEVEDCEHIGKSQYGQPYISFRTKLPNWLSGSYNDQYSKVYYVIRGYVNFTRIIQCSSGSCSVEPL